MVLLIWGSFQRKRFIPSGAVPGLRGFCFSFVLFQRKFVLATALAILCLCLLPCCSRLTRKYLWLLLVPMAGPVYAGHVLSLPGPSWGLTANTHRGRYAAFSRNCHSLHYLQNNGRTVRAEAKPSEALGSLCRW